jgi:3-deoxy-manno-octulosonate cytidylyltransferase (CMP-KDO synthetase)
MFRDGCKGLNIGYWILDIRYQIHGAYMNIIGVIPARYGSTRLKGKMLIKVKGKTIIERVLERAKKIKSIKQLYVATDNKKIKQIVESAGGRAIMTPVKCASGTERIREALKSIKANMNDIIVNIQGDEPLLEYKLVDKMVQALVKDKTFDAATIATPLKSEKEFREPSNVKVVIGATGNALYFSRAMIPFPREGRLNGSVLKHLGVYAYRKPVLDKWHRLKSRYEKVEKLEQLRMIENGCQIKVIVGTSRMISLDTKKDLLKIKSILK